MLTEDFPVADKFAWQYKEGEDPVRPEKRPLLSTQMRKLHEWYLEVAKEGREMLMAAVKMKHYNFQEDEIHIELEEFFQLFNQDALDKSLVSCYCL